MEWKDVASTIANAAPGLGALLGGPVGAGIGTGVKLLASAFGLSDNATPEQITQAISQDPEAALKLRMADMQYQLELNKQDLEETKTYFEDKDSARSREVEFVKATGRRDTLQAVLAIFGVCASVGLICALIFYGLPAMTPEAAALVGGFIGIIISEYKTVFQYFFGSSRGSDRKTDIMSGNGKH
jgi:hypothetical protein